MTMLKNSICHCGKDGHPLHSINCPAHGHAAKTADIARYICRHFICATTCSRECGYGSAARAHAEAIFALATRGERGQEGEKR